MDPVRVVVLDDYQSVAARFGDWGRLDGAEVTFVAEHMATDDELVALVDGFDVIVAMRERTAFPAPVLERLTRPRLIVTTGPRNAVIDVPAARAHGIEVCGTGGLLTPTSEHTWALILALLRHVPTDDAVIRAGGWQTTIGSGLAGKRLGIVGLGRLGTLVARVGEAFEMDVVAWSPNLTDERAGAAGVDRVDKDELFATSDVVTVHMVLSDFTRGLVSADDLARMKPTAVFVNTSRGPLVEEGALVDVLRRGAIRGAAVDVWEVEPLPADHPFRSLPNTVVTPHMGYVTEEMYAVFFRHVVDDIAAWMAGSPKRLVE